MRETRPRQLTGAEPAAAGAPCGPQAWRVFQGRPFWSASGLGRHFTGEEAQSQREGGQGSERVPQVRMRGLWGDSGS